MNKWLVLGIDETTDLNEIKKCYLSKLEKVHPEEDPEGFKVLRSAYEEALKYAKENNEEEKNSDVDKWMEEVKKVYNTFSLRINEESWRELLKDPISFSLENREEVIEKLLTFLMESFNLPKKIWVLLDRYFSIIEIKDDLYEIFPRDFIDFVIRSIKYDGIINYDLFEIDDSKNYDGWISLYNKINTELNSSEEKTEEIKNQLKELRAFGINHPYEKILNARYYLKIEDTKSAREICDSIDKKYDNDVALIYCMAEIEWIEKNYNEAEKLYVRCLEIDSDNNNFKMGLADVFLEQGKAKEAKEIYSNLLETNHYNEYLRYRLQIANEKIIEEGQVECNDISELFYLAWCCYENSKYKKGIDIVKKINPESSNDRRQKYDILGRCYLALDDYKKSLKYFQLWLEDELNKNDDDDEDKDIKKKRIAYIHSSKGKVFFYLKIYEEALQCYDEALEIEENIHYIINKCEVLNKLKRYNESLELSNRAEKIDNSLVSIYLHKAEAMFHLGYYSDAMQCCDIAMDIFPYFKDIFILKEKIYNKCNKYEEVLEIVKQCEKLEIKDDEILLYKAIALMNSDKFDEGYEILRNLKESDNDDVRCQAYYEIAIIEYDKDKYNEALRDVNRAIEVNSDFIENYYLRGAIFTEKGLYDSAIESYQYAIDNNGNKEFVYYQLGNLYKKMGDIDKAIEYFQKVLDANDENPYANGELAELYEKKQDEDKVLHYINEQLQVNPSDYHHIKRGLIYARRGMMKEAKADYDNAIEINPENFYAYNNIGYLYQERGDFETAIKYYKESISNIGGAVFLLAYNNIADSYVYLKDYEMALNYLNEGLKKMPNHQSFLYNKGKVLRSMHRYNEALEAFKKGCSMYDADKDEYYSEIALTYLWMKNDRKAIKWYKKSLMINNRNHNAICSIGDIYKRKKRYRRAKKYYLKLYEIGEDMFYYIYSGDLYKEMNKLDKAKKCYEIAIEKCNDEDIKEAKKFSEIGYCYRQLGNIDEALKYLNKAIEVDPCYECKGRGCHESYNRLGELYESQGDYEMALKYYKKALEMEDDIEYLENIERIEKIKGEQ